MTTAREKAKEQRRRELLAAAASIMAERGFHQTRLGDVGAAVGISGPGIYRLVDGARAVITRHDQAGGADPAAVLADLVDFHVEFAVTEPDRIRVQEREIGNLVAHALEKVRSLQRTYLSLWTDVLLQCRPDLDRAQARLRVQLVAGLINSSRHVIHWAGPDLVRDQATRMSLASLRAE